MTYYYGSTVIITNTFTQEWGQYTSV